MDGNNEQLYIKGQPIIQLKCGEADFWSIVSFGGQIQYKGIAEGKKGDHRQPAIVYGEEETRQKVWPMV